MDEKNRPREEIVDEMLALGVAFTLVPPPSSGPRLGATLSVGLPFFAVFACGALVAMAADRLTSAAVFTPAEERSPALEVPPRASAMTAIRPAVVESLAPLTPPPEGTAVTTDPLTAQEPVADVGPALSPGAPRTHPRRSWPAPRPGATSVVGATPSTAQAASGTSGALRWETGNLERLAMPPSLDALLDDALGGAPDVVTTHAPAARPLQAVPTRRQVLTTLRALEGEVRMCSAGTGVLRTSLVVAGRTGDVGSVRVTGADAGIRRCVARVLRSAHFPRFSRERFEVSFPYRL